MAENHQVAPFEYQILQVLQQQLLFWGHKTRQVIPRTKDHEPLKPRQLQPLRTTTTSWFLIVVFCVGILVVLLHCFRAQEWVCFKCDFQPQRHSTQTAGAVGCQVRQLFLYATTTRYWWERRQTTTSRTWPIRCHPSFCPVFNVHWSWWWRWCIACPPCNGQPQKASNGSSSIIEHVSVVPSTVLWKVDDQYECMPKKKNDSLVATITQRSRRSRRISPSKVQPNHRTKSKGRTSGGTGRAPRTNLEHQQWGKKLPNKRNEMDYRTIPPVTFEIIFNRMACDKNLG